MGSEIRIYRIADRTRIMTIQNGPPKVLALSLDGKGSRLALGTKGGMVFVYDLPEGKNMGRLVHRRADSNRQQLRHVRLCIVHGLIEGLDS